MRTAEGGADDWAIDQAFAEYKAYSAGERLSLVVDESSMTSAVNHPEAQVQRFRFAWPSGGEVHFCGAPADEAHWHAAYVSDAGQLVTPLAVGELADVRTTWARIRDTVDPHQLPPPSVRLADDQRRYFKPAHGRFLVGVAQQESSTILLVALGRQLAVILVEGSCRVVLDIKAPLDLREVLVERMRSFQRSQTSNLLKPSREPDQVRVSSATRARYRQILHGLPIDVVGGPSIPDVVWRCFKGLEHRAMALRSEPVRRRLEQGNRKVQEPCRPRRLKGKKYLPRLLRALFQCSLKGSDDLVGLTGVLRDEVQRHDPSLVITLEALADTLNMLRAAGTCLVTRDEGERIWHIHLVGLNDPSSALHRRLLEETPIPFRFPTSAMGQVLAEDDEATRTADQTTPSLSSRGGTSGDRPQRELEAGIDDAAGVPRQATHTREPVAHEALERTYGVIDAVAATSTTTSVTEAGAASTELADAARDEDATRLVEAVTAVAAENTASSSEGDAAAAARLASSPLAPLLALAVMLGAWESASARHHDEVIMVRARLGAVLRDLVHLQARGVPRPLEHVVEPAREGPDGRPAEPERIDAAEETASVPEVYDRLSDDAPGEADVSVGAIPAIGLIQPLGLDEPVATSATPPGPLALGSLGARGPPGSWR